MECNPSEPTAKKLKLDMTQNKQVNSLSKDSEIGGNICTNNTTWPPCFPYRDIQPKQPRAILHEKYYRSLETVDVLTCTVNEKSQTSRLVREIGQVFKLDELKHLKRVKNEGGLLKIIITTIPDVAMSTGHMTLNELFDGSSVNTDGLSEPSVTHVPKYPALTRKQYDDWSKIWPITFHEDKHITKLINGAMFDETELQTMMVYMEEAINAALMAKKKGLCPVGAVIVNPVTNKILCKAHDQSSEHPLRHTTMVCIDLVARSHGGGAWDIDSDLECEDFSEDGDCRTMNDKHGPMLPSSDIKQGAIIDSNVDCSSRTEANHKRTLRNDDPCSGNLHRVSLDSNSCCSETKYEKTLQIKDEDIPYLCTGYDLYITREPCAMCAMALLHSRIRRVFYGSAFSSFGGLGSKYKIHCLDGTNHHFEVFSGLLETKCSEILSMKESNFV